MNLRAPRPTVSSLLLTLSIPLVAGLAAAGCFRHSEVITTMTNPLVAGGVMPNEVQQQHSNDERTYQIPAGSLTDSAMITRMDASESCFQVTLRALDGGNGQTWTDLSTWGLSLLTSDVEIVEPTVQLNAPTQQQYNGRVRQRVQVGEQTVCVDDRGRVRTAQSITAERPCGRWEQRPVYENRWVPGIVSVTTGGGEICFLNQGHVTPETTQVTLKMQRGRRRVDFVWEFN